MRSTQCAALLRILRPGTPHAMQIVRHICIDSDQNGRDEVLIQTGPIGPQRSMYRLHLSQACYSTAPARATEVRNPRRHVVRGLPAYASRLVNAGPHVPSGAGNRCCLHSNQDQPTAGRPASSAFVRAEDARARPPDARAGMLVYGHVKCGAAGAQIHRCTVGDVVLELHITRQLVLGWSGPASGRV
ncbi:hypothetical protein EVG20_g7448 [Dentipellis fragilis]|uniref:Uncharacterized protein n=1 Tax=Dentipellis fragilis TaxID=205917 RepID=A0A4Y9YFZ3_9AGAM|nr:hypothetical protein EVG20_g7448 [Dentipellis fragilis]